MPRLHGARRRAPVYGIPHHWYTSSARPLDPEPPEMLAPAFDLSRLEPASDDPPQAFGRKCVWLALQAEPARAIEAMGIERAAASGWARGLAIAQTEPQVVFVTPRIRGWTLVVSPRASFYDEGGGMEAHVAWLRALSLRVLEAQEFVSQRTASLFGWARARQGEMLRSCRFGEDPEWSLGEPGREEQGHLSAPDEDSVLAIARRWSVDPESLGETSPPSRGWLGLLPATPVRRLALSEYQRGGDAPVAAPPAGRLCCRVCWNPAARKRSYVLQPVAASGERRASRRAVSDHAQVVDLVAQLRATLEASGNLESSGRRGRSADEAAPDEVVVEVEQQDGQLLFWPMRRRFGTLRRHAASRSGCRWSDRVGVVAWHLDAAIVRALELRPLWRRLVELGRDS